jgi:hypothetical protein
MLKYSSKRARSQKNTLETPLQNARTGLESLKPSKMEKRMKMISLSGMEN